MQRKGGRSRFITYCAVLTDVLEEVEQKRLPVCVQWAGIIQATFTSLHHIIAPALPGFEPLKLHEKLAFDWLNQEQ